MKTIFTSFMSRLKGVHGTHSAGIAKWLLFVTAMFLWAGSSLGTTVQIGSGATTNSYFPIYTCYGYSYSQQLYLASEITSGGGASGQMISKIRFYYNSGGTTFANWVSWNVYLGNTAKATFASTTDWIAVGSMTQVFSGNIPTPVGGTWLELTLSTPFIYTGGNLVVAVDENTAGYSCTAAWNSFASGSNRGILYYSDGTNPDPASPPTANYGPNATLSQIQLEMAAPAPYFSANPASLSFGYVPSGNYSSEQTYILAGNYLTAGPVTITAPSNFEVSLTSGSGFGSSVTVAYTPPTLANTTIYVRFHPTAPGTNYSGNITNVGGGASKNVPVSGTSDLFSNYCASAASYSGDEEITSVQFGSTLNNTTACASLVGSQGTATGTADLYSNFVNAIPATNVVRGTTVPVTVEISECNGSAWSHMGKVYIDFNQNGSLADAGEEFVIYPYNASLTHTVVYNIPIPAGASTGNTLMRVIVKETSSFGPCDVSSWGETEDYRINIVGLPAATTTAASGIASSTATLNGNITPNAGSTTVTFQYGTDLSYGSTVTATPSSVPGTNGMTIVSANITGLNPNQLYHFRVVGVNAAGTTNGNDMTFTTSAIAPAVVTNPADGVSNIQANLHGTVTANNSATTCSFDWGQTTGYGNNIAATPGTVNGMTPTIVSAILSGLITNTTYHFRARGVNSAGVTLGADQQFTTVCPTVGSPGTITGDASVCQGTSGHVYACAAITNAIAYMWSVPTGAQIISGANTNAITVSFNNTAVSGTITVYGTNVCSNGPTSTFAVTVNTTPSPTLLGPSLPCQGVNYTYTTQAGQSGYTWVVSAGGQIISGQGTSSLTVKWNNTGAQTVSVNYANANGCYAFNPFVYNVNVQAAPVPTITGSTGMCINSGFYYYTTEAGKSNYNWTISGGGSITFGQGTNQIQVTWNQPGNQSVSVNYSTSAGCYAINPTVYNVAVNDIPGAAGTVNGTSNVCGGATGISYVVEPIPYAVSYVWSLPSGATITSGEGTNNISVDFAPNASSGNITVYGNNLCGNGAVSPAFALNVVPVPGTAGNISGANHVCQGESGVVYSVAAVTGATGYTWNIPSGASIVSGDNTNTITVDYSIYASSGTVTVFASNSCGNGPASSLTVTVSPIPAAPVISIVGNSLHSSVAAGNQWYLDGASITGATGQDYTPAATGLYWDVISANGCSSDTSNNIYYTLLGINDPHATGFSIYPVPNDGNFTVTVFSPAQQSYTLNIYNNIGVEVYNSGTFNVNGTVQKSIDLRPVPSGLYTIILKTSDNKIVKKFIVNR